METANHGDNILLTKRCELLSSVPNNQISNNLKGDDMGASPMLATWGVLHKHRSRDGPRPRRSRSSPVRSRLSESSSPERRARSPSVSATRLVLPDPAPTVLSPHDTLYTNQSSPGVGPSAMSYFSPRPPSMPLYIVPLPPNPSATAAEIKKLIRLQHESKVKTRNKTGRRIARHILDLIFKKIPLNTENVGVDAAEVENGIAVKEAEVSPRSNRSIAIQALSKYGNNRKFTTDEEDECSSSETSDDYEWAGSVRALRDSHVRLVLRQLRHLRDIERLSRALRRERAHE